MDRLSLRGVSSNEGPRKPQRRGIKKPFCRTFERAMDVADAPSSAAADLADVVLPPPLDGLGSGPSDLPQLGPFEELLSLLLAATPAY